MIKNAAILIFSLFSVPVVAQQSWTLPQAIEYAVENNLQVKQAGLNARLSAAEYKQSKLNLLPNLNGDASHSYNFGRFIDPTTNQFITTSTQTNTFSLNSGITLFDGLRNFNSIKQSKYQHLASVYGVEETKNDIILNIVAAYLQILLNEEQENVARQQLEISNEQLEQTRKLVAAGALPEGSLLEIEAEVATDELNVINAENQTMQAYLTFAILLEIDPAQNFLIQKPDIDLPDESGIDTLDPENIFYQAMQKLPEIKRAEYEVKSAQKGVAVAKGGLYPVLTAFGTMRTNYSDAYQRATGFIAIDTIGYTRTGEGVVGVLPQSVPLGYESVGFQEQLDENLSEVAGLSLSIPIFNKWQTRTNIERAQISLMSSEIALEQAKKNLKQDIQQAYADARAAAQRYFAALRSVNAMERAFEYAEEKRALGLISTFDYITAKNNLTRTRSELVQAKYNYVFQVKILDFYQGNEINLN